MFIPTDFEEALVKKMTNEAYKTCVRNCYPPEQAERICRAVDVGEKTEHYIKAYNEFANMLAQHWNQQLQYMQCLVQQMNNKW